MTKKKSKIKCDVESCKHQNSEEEICELDEIKVSSCDNCDNDEVIENKQTMCDSFDCDEEVVEELEEEQEDVEDENEDEED